MATKYNDVFVNYKLAKNEPPTIDNIIEQFSNLNLNHTQTSSYVLPIETSSSKSNNNNEQYFDRSLVPSVNERNANYITPTKTTASNALSSNYSNLLKQSSEEKVQQNSSNITTTTTNKSTLSLHIEAYENSFKAADDTETSGKNINVKMEHNKLDSQQQSPFDLQRKQEDAKNTIPEITKFKASQKLFNPNESMAPVKKEEDSQICDDYLMEFNQKAAKILDIISPNLVTMTSFEEIFEKFHKIPINAILKEYGGKGADKYYKNIPNIKIIQVFRAYMIGSTIKAVEEEDDDPKRILSTDEAMGILVKKNDNRKTNGTTVSDLKKIFRY